MRHQENKYQLHGSFGAHVDGSRFTIVSWPLLVGYEIARVAPFPKFPVIKRRELRVNANEQQIWLWTRCMCSMPTQYLISSRKRSLSSFNSYTRTDSSICLSVPAAGIRYSKDLIHQVRRKRVLSGDCTQYWWQGDMLLWVWPLLLYCSSSRSCSRPSNIQSWQAYCDW